MTREQFEALKATMPWTHQVTGHPQVGGLIRVINNRGEEVSIFDMVAFLDVITQKIATNPPKDTP
jgi:hypothetical protein